MSRHLPQTLEEQLNQLLFRDRLLMQLSRIALAAHVSGYLEAADALNQACDQLGCALDLLGSNRRKGGKIS